MQRINLQKIVILQERGENMKKQRFVNFILLFSILLIAIFFVFLFKMNHRSEDNKLVGKAEQEIKQLEDKIIAMMNHLNQISFSNFVLVEEKGQNSDSNAQGENKGQDSSSSGQGSSKQGSSESSNGSSSSGNSGNSQSKDTGNQKENTKFELKNSGILSNKGQEVDWDSVKSNAEIVYATWPTAVVDLHELNVKNEDILNFSTVLDQVTLSAKKEDKTATLNNLASLYAFLPNYRSQISEDSKSIHMDYTRACVLNSYALVEQNKWEEMQVQIANAIQYFSNIMNHVEENNAQSQSRISKIYVLLNELSKSVETKDKDLYYIKYRNVMEELVNLQK